RHRGSGGYGRRRRGAQIRGLHHRGTGHHRAADTHPGHRTAAVAGVSHRRPPRLRRGPAAQPGQERHRGMKQFTTRLEVATRGKGLYEISRQVVAWVKDTGMKTGLLTVFIQHTSASLTFQENADPDV